LDLSPEQKAAVKGLMLLSMKPVIYAANVADTDLATGNELSKSVFEFAKSEGNTAVLVSAQVEAELALLTPADKDEFLKELGVDDENCGLKVKLFLFSKLFLIYHFPI
jgi:ribosome-binding ATPase YchF (GTP1/OBG family)